MYRKFIVVLIVALVFSALPSFHMSAANIPLPSPNKVAQTASGCQNADFLTGLGKDMTAIGTTFKSTDMTDVSSLAQSILTIAATRQKYEDLTNVPSGCLATQLAAWLTFANASDLLALTLASVTDTKNADAYKAVLSSQNTRFQNDLQNVLVYAGLATPQAAAAATMAATGSASAAAPLSCKDPQFLTTLGTDFTNFGTAVKNTDMTDVSAIAQTLLSTAALRQKYEDLPVVSDDCLATQLYIVIAFANGSDVLALALAANTDTKNADAYKKALTAQSARFQTAAQIVVNLISPAASGTMAATMAATSNP